VTLDEGDVLLVQELASAPLAVQQSIADAAGGGEGPSAIGGLLLLAKRLGRMPGVLLALHRVAQVHGYEAARSVAKSLRGLGLLNGRLDLVLAAPSLDDTFGHMAVALKALGYGEHQTMTRLLANPDLLRPVYVLDDMAQVAHVDGFAHGVRQVASAGSPFLKGREHEFRAAAVFTGEGSAVTFLDKTAPVPGRVRPTDIDLIVDGRRCSVKAGNDAFRTRKQFKDWLNAAVADILADAAARGVTIERPEEWLLIVVSDLSDVKPFVYKEMAERYGAAFTPDKWLRVISVRP